MLIPTALKNQHHAALAMMREAIERCPEEVWTGGEFPRNYWRICYHALGYLHLYLYEDVQSWKKWPKHKLECTWLDGDAVPNDPPYSREELLEVVELIDSEVDHRIDSLDLNAEDCGFAWYPNVSQVELLILSLRHFHGHLGQLHEILIANGEDVKWLGQVS